MELPSELLARVLARVDDYVYVWEYRPDGTSAPLVENIGSFAFLGDVEDDRREEDLWRERVHPDDRAAYDAVTDAQARGEGGAAEYRLVRSDGTQLHVFDRWRGHVREDGVRIAEGIISDVTKLKAFEAALREREEQFRLLATSAPVGIYLADLDGELTFVNERWRVMYGLAGDTALGSGWVDVVHPEDRESAAAAWVDAVRQGHEFEHEFRLLVDGFTRWVSSRACPVRDADGRVTGYIGTDSDVTERRMAQNALERLTRTDALTGLANRRQLSAWLREGLRRTPAGVGLVLLDIDHFKRINDTHGHGIGDRVLVEAGRRLRAARRDGYVARWGGEEFAVVVPAAGDEDELLRTAEALRSAIGADVIAGLHVTASAGAARTGDGIVSSTDLIDAADRALYAAKRRGRDQTRLASQLTPQDLIPEEPEAVRVAQGLALAASVREGVAEIGASRVADLASEVARRLGLPEHVQLRCRLGGLLRDVGKVALPDRVLFERGPLDAEAWAVMRTHSAIGERIVLQNPLLRDAAPAVRHHHERWDGSGYPDGLAGEAIPIEARVVAACDAFGAMTSDRPWRRGLEHEDAIAELRRVAGTQLDASVAAAVCDAVDDGRRSSPLRGAA
jgi:diguanylate cyclase (GGDEF)-like protein/PAS domain S-box-containing protein